MFRRGRLRSVFGIICCCVAAAAGAQTFHVVKEYGSISVSAATPGVVFIDGVESGRLTEDKSSEVFSRIETGTHQVSIRYGNGHEEKQSVTVMADRTTYAKFSYVVEREQTTASSSPKPATPATSSPSSTGSTSRSAQSSFSLRVIGGLLWGGIFGGIGLLAEIEPDSVVIAAIVGFVVGFVVAG